MKLLTIPQPRASLLAGGRIVFDTRPEPTDYRGPIAIHASSSLRTELCLSALEEPICGAMKLLGITLATMPRGAIIAVAELADCVQIRYSAADAVFLPPAIYDQASREIGFGQWQSGLWAYRFEKVTPIGPIVNVPGRRFPTEIRGDLLDMVLEAMAAAPV